MPGSKFVNAFADFIKKGHKVLDLGSDLGIYCDIFVERGASVIAVDIEKYQHLNNAVDFRFQSVESFVETNTADYDLIFMRNILQFLDKEWVFEILFPWLYKQTTREGVIGIKTFYQEPDPPFMHSIRSTFSSEELIYQLPLWHEVYVKEYEHDGPDLAGEMRHFFITDLIMKKI